MFLFPDSRSLCPRAQRLLMVTEDEVGLFSVITWAFEVVLTF